MHTRQSAARAAAAGDTVQPAVRAGSARGGAYAVAAAGGAAIAAGFLDPRLYPLAWVGFAPVLWVLRRAPTDRSAAGLGFAAGFICNLLGFYWLVHTMHVFGGFPLVVAGFFYVCLTAYSSCQFVLFALGVRRLGYALWGLGPALLWTALEFLYLNLFPWRLANTQFHLPVLLQIGDLAGPYPLSLAIVWINAALVLAADRPHRLAPLAAAVALVAAIAGYGAVRAPQIEAVLRATTPFHVGLVQGNVSIVHKRDAAYFEINVERYRALSAGIQDQVDLLIWPETVAQWWTPADADTLAPEHHPFPQLRTHLIYGGPAYRYTDRSEPESYNSAFLVGPGDRLLGRYDKHILMPFGEYLPGARLLPAIKAFSPYTGDFTAGRTITTFTIPAATLGPLICYEDVVTGIPRAMTRAGAAVLFNILNDAWFGDSAGPHEHQALALWRAVENRRYLLRASNSGVTSIIDPLGRIVAELEPFSEGVLVAAVHPLSMLTIYTRVGDVFGWLVAAAAGALLVHRRGAAHTAPPAAVS